MPLKHLPIQPANVSIAPSPHPHGPRDSRKPAGHGLVIRTSRQWVLPPRPKPGRKPSLSAPPSRATSDHPNSSKCASATATKPAVSALAMPVSTVPERSVLAKNSDRPGTRVDHVSGELENSGPTFSSEPKTAAAATTASQSSRCSSRSQSLAPITVQTAAQRKPSAAPNARDAAASASATAPAVPAAQALPSTEFQEPVSSSKSADSAETSTTTSSTTMTTTTTTTTTNTTPSPSISSPMLKKLTKTALKKEIQQLKLENFKLKQEMGHLVGNLQDLKQKVPFLSNPTFRATPSSNPYPSLSKKRPFLGSEDDTKQQSDSTDNFLKFEDDDEEEEEEVINANAVISGVPMKPTMSFSSQYSSKTNLTDDEDPGFSSSTPSSLFSAELQRSVTNSSFASTQQYLHNFPCGPHNTSGTPGYSPHHHSSNSPSSMIPAKLPVSGIDNVKFIDDYEHQDFYSKHRHLFDNKCSSALKDSMCTTSMNGNSTASPTIPNHPGDLHLDAIKEEDLDFRLDHDFGNDDMSILNFLEDHGTKSVNATTTTAVTETTPRWAMKDERESDINIFQEFNSEPQFPKQEFYMPPSLEELMGDQDPDRLDTEIKREDDGMLKMDVFDFA
ncbi:LANO_0D06656g1_1 [Lachancea nothofagi CBS 11611]|uniref:LANO_0D06656g1_1 n=1 Tax=Lachancea nothofagi CBS 11611 TaxID=1266666 RepID=A0A1G4JHF1_9SACH|nr:LANO_0D06656g1_1 [Lachancea nothofagi CBS 11611]